MREISCIGDMPIAFGNRLATGVQTPVQINLSHHGIQQVELASVYVRLQRRSEEGFSQCMDVLHREHCSDLASVLRNGDRFAQGGVQKLPERILCFDSGHGFHGWSLIQAGIATIARISAVIQPAMQGAGLRLLKEHEARAKALQDALTAGEESGDPRPFDQDASLRWMHETHVRQISSYFLLPLAEQDLECIWTYTAERWSITQADS